MLSFRLLSICYPFAIPILLLSICHPFDICLLSVCYPFVILSLCYISFCHLSGFSPLMTWKQEITILDFFRCVCIKFFYLFSYIFIFFLHAYHIIISIHGTSRKGQTTWLISKQLRNVSVTNLFPHSIPHFVRHILTSLLCPSHTCLISNKDYYCRYT